MQVPDYYNPEARRKMSLARVAIVQDFLRYIKSRGIDVKAVKNKNPVHHAWKREDYQISDSTRTLSFFYPSPRLADPYARVFYRAKMPEDNAGQNVFGCLKSISNPNPNLVTLSYVNLGIVGQKGHQVDVCIDFAVDYEIYAAYLVHVNSALRAR